MSESQNSSAVNRAKLYQLVLSYIATFGIMF